MHLQSYGKSGKFLSADPELNAQTARALLNNLSPFGQCYKFVFRKATVLDLGSAHPRETNFMPFLAKIFKSSRYVGIDTIATDMRWKGFKMLAPHTPLYYIRGDMLNTVSRISPSLKDKRVVLTVGLLAIGKKYLNDTAKELHIDEYIASLSQEIKRFTKPGDFWILGPGTFDFNPENFGFKIRSKASQSLPRENNITIYQR